MATRSITKPEVNKEELVLQNRLSGAKIQAETLTVRNAEECANAKMFLKSVRDVVKQIGFLKDPVIASAKEHLDFAREDKNKWVRQAEVIEGIAEAKVNVWTRAERESAEREETRLNEERRREAARLAEENRKAAEAKAEADRKQREKEIEEARKAGELSKRESERLKTLARDEEQSARTAAELQRIADQSNVQEVTVKPNIPTVAGTRSRVNWKFRILDASRIPREYMQPNEMKIGADVRFWKDKAVAEAKIPGVEVWPEDSN